MFQEMLLSKYADVPYQQNGNGNPGYDCCTLVLAVLKDFGYTFTGDLKEAERRFWQTLDMQIIQNILDEYATKIWAGAPKSFDHKLVQPGDILVYSFLKSALHLGVYIGYNQVITMKDNVKSAVINIADPVYKRMVVAHYRVRVV